MFKFPIQCNWIYTLVEICEHVIWKINKGSLVLETAASDYIIFSTNYYAHLTEFSAST